MTRFHATSLGLVPFTEAEETEADALEAKALSNLVEFEKLTYQRNRAAEYPSMHEYLDAVVKGDTEQMQKYIADCLAVKAKYPKPE
jgi:hypothetical protein